jgi:hypothetical protein
MISRQRNWKNSTPGINVLAKKQGLHTMIGVIDAENQSSITFHEKFDLKR